MDILPGDQPTLTKLKVSNPRLRINHTFVTPGRIDLAATQAQAIHRTKNENRAIIVHKHAAPARVVEDGTVCPPETNMDEAHHEFYDKGALVPDFFKEDK